MYVSAVIPIERISRLSARHTDSSSSTIAISVCCMLGTGIETCNAAVAWKLQTETSGKLKPRILDFGPIGLTATEPKPELRGGKRSEALLLGKQSAQAASVAR